VKTTRQIYCQYLLSSQINYTCTNLADHVDNLDHNSVYRYLKNEKLTPRLIWEKARETLVQVADGYLIFDDTVADKSHSHDIVGVRRQYSGNAGGVVKGIGIVTCVYYNAAADRFWVIDYRIFDPDRDGKTKLDHVFGDARFDCATRLRVSHRANGQLVCHDCFDEPTDQSGKAVLLSD